MAKRVTLPCAGLATDPNPLLTAAAGGMRTADNVIVVSDGAVMLRPGFGERYAKAGTDYELRSLCVFDEQPIAVSTDGSAWRIEHTAGTYTGAAIPPDTTLSQTQFAEARKSLYYTTSTGLRKLADSADSATASAGVAMLVSTLGAVDIAGTGTIGPGQWTYRLVFVQTDANGYIRRSAPSMPFWGRSTNVGDRYDWSSLQTARVHIPSWLAAGDQIEAYRTRVSGNVNTPPGAEHYLAFTYTVTSTDVSNQYCVFPDDYTVDDALGAALYTNPSQLGAVAAKEPPPRATALAYWNSCLWMGGTLERYRRELTIVNVDNSASGLTNANCTGDFTSGNNTVTNVVMVASTFASMVIGQAITDALSPAVAGTRVPAGTYITNITGAGPYTITMSANALATAAGVSFSTHDIVTVGGVEFYRAGVQYLPGYALSGLRCFAQNSSSTVKEEMIAGVAMGLALCVNTYAVYNPSFGIRATHLGSVSNPVGSVAPGALIFEEVGVGGSVFTVRSVTKPSAVNPTTASAISATADSSPARLFWSDPDEPEAVPIGQYVDIGNQRDPILALVSLRAALLVFKRDGVYRITGSPPDAWSVELLDGSTRLLYGSCADVLDDVAFAMTNRGAVMVDEGGVRNISERRIGRALLEAQRLIGASGGLGFVRAWAQAGCVVFGVPTAADASDKVSSWYVYRPVSDSWTRWPIDATCAVQDWRGASFFHGRPGMWELRKATSALESLDETGFDELYQISAWTYDADAPSITIAAANISTWAPKVNDFAWASNEYRRITAVEIDGTDTICTLESAFTGAPAQGFGYETIVPVLQWQAHSADPVTASLYPEIQVLMDFTGEEDADAPALRFEVGASTDRIRTPATEVVSVTRSASPPLTSILRIHPDRDVARATHFFPYLTGASLYMPWICLGVALIFEPASERNAR